MANSSVIDSLVVTLGLQADGFTKGIASAGESLVGFTAKLAGMFFAVRGIEDLVGHFKDLSQSLFHLGIDARNLDVAGTRLSQWGEVARLAGGRAEDATATIAGLNQAIFGLKYQGELSGPLMQLMRFGINPFRRLPNGSIAAGDEETIWRQAAQRGMQLEPYSQAMRYQLMQSFGLQGGVASAAAQGPAALEKYLATAAKDQKSLTQQMIDHQVELNQNVISLTSHLNANSAALLDKFTPWMESIVADLRLISKPMQWLAEQFGGKNRAIEAWKMAPDLLKGMAHEAVPTLKRTAWALKFRALEDYYGLPHGMLDKIATAESNYNADAVSPKGARGTFQLMPKYFPNAGQSTGADAESAAQYLVQLYKQFGSWEAAVAAYNEGPGAYAKGKMPAETRAYLGKVFGNAPVTPTAARPASVDFLASERARNATQVQIDSMTINTQAKDANGIATDLNAALSRKLLVANTDPGMQ